MNIHDVLEAFNKHEKWLKSETGGGRLVLDGEDLSHMKLWNKRLSQAILRNCNLTGTDLFLTDCREIDLTNSDLSNARINSCCFNNGTLASANLTGAYTLYARFLKTNIVGTIGKTFTSLYLPSVSVVHVDTQVGINRFCYSVSGAIEHIDFIVKEEKVAPEDKEELLAFLKTLPQ